MIDLCFQIFSADQYGILHLQTSAISLSIAIFQQGDEKSRFAILDNVITALKNVNSIVANRRRNLRTFALNYHTNDKLRAFSSLQQENLNNQIQDHNAALSEGEDTFIIATLLTMGLCSYHAALCGLSLFII
jgi:ABC-type phosphate/phosphonate transport system ATPase subunit